MEATVTEQAKRTAVKNWLGAGSINIFGIQFSGKDTQCRRLAAWIGGEVVGGGDILRNSDGVPARVRAIVDSGVYPDVDDYVAIVTPYLSRSEFAGRPLLLSAVGRSHGEEPAVMEAAKAAGHELRAVVWLELDEDEVWRRWRLIAKTKDRETRVDDDETGLRHRLEQYRSKTLPVREYYGQRDLLILADGSKSPGEVAASILDGLYRLATRPD